MRIRLFQIFASSEVEMNFREVGRVIGVLKETSRNFIDATSAAQTFQLPDGSLIDKDFFVVKTDASGNAVTITAATGQTIEGSSTLALAAQYSQALLTFHGGVWYRMDA